MSSKFDGGAFYICIGRTCSVFRPRVVSVRVTTHLGNADSWAVGKRQGIEGTSQGMVWIEKLVDGLTVSLLDKVEILAQW